MNAAGSAQASTSASGTVSHATATPSSCSATRWGRPAQKTAHVAVVERVAPAGVLEHRAAAEREDELDVVVPVGAGHRGHGREPAREAEDLVQGRRPAHARIREGSACMAEVCPDPSPLASSA